MYTTIKKQQSGLSSSARLSQIVEHGMCIGCGLCESLASNQEITMKVVSNGTRVSLVLAR